MFPMTRALKTTTLVGISYLLSACLTEKEESAIPASPTPWGDNVQEWYFLKSATGGVIERTEEPCGEVIDYGPIRYRFRGDSLDLGWLFTNPVINVGGEIVAVDSFWFGGTYERTAGVAGRLLGSWRVRRFGPWEAGKPSSSRIDSLRDEWNFMFGDEEIRITNRVLAFAYPTMNLYVTRSAEYRLRDDEAVSFEYIGRDSLRISRDGETASLKHLPLHSFRARSTNPSRTAIHVSLADSCTFPAPVVDTTWISEVLWGPEILPGDELPKRGGRATSRFRTPRGR